MPSEEFLTVEEVAAFLKVEPRWVYARTANRTIPVRKLGGHVRIPKRELEAWIEREGKSE